MVLNNLITIICFLLLAIIFVLVILISRQSGISDQLKAQFFLQFYEKTNSEEFRRIEMLLNELESFDFRRLVEDEKEAFENYLKFFDFVIQMRIQNRFSYPEAKLLIGHHIELLNRHFAVRNHIAEHNYKNLDDFLTAVSGDEKKPLSSAPH